MKGKGPKYGHFTNYFGNTQKTKNIKTARNFHEKKMPEIWTIHQLFG